MNHANKIFDIVHNCSKWDGYTFDPYTYIYAVNTLHKQDKTNVLAALRDYCHWAIENADWLSNSTKVFLLLRVLFVPTDQNVQFPTIHVGKPLDAEPPSIQDFPLYPLALIQDVPLLVVPGFILGGLPEDPLEHIKFCETYCHLRITPLHPPDNPLILTERLMTSNQWYRKKEGFENDQAILQAQLLRLVRAVYTIPGVDEPAFFSYLKTPGLWQRCVNSFKHLTAVWDEKQGNYVFRDRKKPSKRRLSSTRKEKQ